MKRLVGRECLEVLIICIGGGKIARRLGMGFTAIKS
jgi:hypothetical protein